MRITGGTLGGRVLVSPRDDRVRPTSDKVRQAVFNVLRHRDFGSGPVVENAAVVDLFAGTGALGLEAVSHGARYALFVEDDAESRAGIRSNIETLGLTGTTKLWRRDATNLGPMPVGAGGPFGLVFLDPPYRKGMLLPALASLLGNGWLEEGATLVAEVEREFSDVAPDAFRLVDDRVYGETRILFLNLSK